MNTTIPAQSVESQLKNETLKGKILVKVAETNDEDLLNEILDFINQKKTVSEKSPIHLSKHIPYIFEQYNETLKKLAE
jgi:hypothetical protein